VGASLISSLRCGKALVLLSMELLGSTSSEAPAMINDNTTLDYYIPEDVAEVLRVHYQIVLPILVALSLVTNSLALIVARRPSLKALHVNQYIILLAIVDTCFSMAFVPHLIDTENCTYSNHTIALYHAYFGQSLPYYFRHISTFLLVSLALDRFLAIWFNQIFQIIRRHTTFRFAILWVWISISVIPHILIGHISPHMNNQWLVLPGSRNTKHPWLKAYKMYATIAFGVLPCMALISLSIGMIIGIIKKMMAKSSPRNTSANRQLSLTIGVLVFNVFYVVSTSFEALLAIRYKIGEGGCYGTTQAEWLKLVANCISMIWTVFNLFVFFAINRDYREELKLVLSSFICGRCIKRK
ncbi:unnamed protein product, partial [Meganyctiphanes norvegica]